MNIILTGIITKIWDVEKGKPPLNMYIKDADPARGIMCKVTAWSKQEYSRLKNLQLGDEVKISGPIAAAKYYEKYNSVTLEIMPRKVISIGCSSQKKKTSTETVYSEEA